MANPILSRAESFTSTRPQMNPYQGQAQYQQVYGQQQGYNQQQGHGPQGYGQPQQYAPQQPAGGAMSMDDVITKTAISLGIVAVVALIAAQLIPLNLLMFAGIASAFAAMAVSWVLSSKRVVPAAGVIAFAVLEGLFVGSWSAFLEGMFPGIVVTAVIATFAAAAVTLAAYRFFNIRIGNKFRKVLVIGMSALALLYISNFVLSLFGVNLGIIQVGGGAGLLPIAISVIAVGLAVMSLIADFDMVERGLANQAPSTESWRAALGLTATMVFLYLEILRIASYFRN